MNDALTTGGPQAAHIAGLYRGFFWVSVIVWVLVVLALAIATWRKRTGEEGPEKAEASPRLARRMRSAITIAITATAVTLVVLIVLSAVTGRALASFTPRGAVEIHVVAHQWWWEFEYESSDPSQHFTTANEIHVPAGRPVLLRLEGRDVIHSFWVPSLHGKRDLIPGKKSTLFLQADTVGEYEGQCAEFCGTQHANMRFLVVADPPDVYQKWVARQLAPAKTPDNMQTLHGQQVFLKSRCINCHRIGGTEAQASNGPDLSHVGGRKTLAARTLPNTPGHLGGWIADPSGVKPGTQMPSTPLGPNDLDDLLAYLGSLQ